MRTTLRFSSLDPVVRTTLNLPYCTVPDFYGGGAQALHMHVVYPVPDPAAPGYPVLLWICGGGWECCDPANRLHDLSYFARDAVLGQAHDVAASRAWPPFPRRSRTSRPPCALCASTPGRSAPTRTASRSWATPRAATW